MHTSSLPHILSPILSHPGLYLHPTAPRASIAWLNSGFSRKKPPPSQSSVPPHRSHSLPVVVRRHYLLPGSRLLRLIGHAEVPGINNPLVHSKVAPASDSGPEPSVE
ncbi:hypothetical protein BU17DRAFT_101499 [Hysterangium stoloniferum]|nr:hypothetical protein BU17DRAFT_101499 [Hysterangium stoloniferum]